MHCLIIDDDPLICDLLDHFCSKIEDIANVTKTNSGFESVNLINRNFFDIVFLDYNLPDITGREILDLIPGETAVVMITSNRDFAVESYDFDKIVDYLVKPIDFPRFFRAVQQVQKYRSGAKKDVDHLFVRDGNKLIKVDLKEVLYFKAERNYMSVVLNDRKVLTLMTLKDSVKKLPDYFQRVHRSYIVNINKIDTIEVNSIKINRTEIPISHSYEKEFHKKINLLN